MQYKTASMWVPEYYNDVRYIKKRKLAKNKQHASLTSLATIHCLEKNSVDVAKNVLIRTFSIYWNTCESERLGNSGIAVAVNDN